MKATDRDAELYNGLGMRLDTVDRFIFDGLQSRFLTVFNTPSVWVTSTDKVKSLDKLFGERDRENVVKYPYVFLKLNSWEKAEDRHNLRYASLRGTRVSVTEDWKSSVDVRYLPVNFQIGVEFTTNNFKDILDYGRRWLFASQLGRLNFQVEYGQTRFDIKAIPEGNLNFPVREADPENIQEYMAESNLVLQGFISEAEPSQQSIVDTPQVTLAVVGEGSNAAETFWSFDFKQTSR